MDFLITNQSLLISLGVLIVIIIIGLIGIPYLKKSGLIKQEDLENTEKAIQLANALIGVVKFDNKDQIKSIFTIVETVFEYITDSIDDTNKEKLAYTAIVKILGEMNVEITKEIQELVELAINSTLGSNTK